MPTQITLPSLGENIESGDVLSILVSEGDTVAKDQDLLELETDKATMPVPSPQAGKIVKVLIAEGQTVPVGAAIFEIETENGAAAKPPKESQPPKASAQAPTAPAKPQPKFTPQEEAAEDETEAVMDQLDEPEETPPPVRPSAGKSSKPKLPPPPEPGVPIIVEEESPKARTDRGAAAPTGDTKSGAQARATRPAAKGAAPLRSAEGDVPGDGHASAAAGPAVRRLAREMGVDLRRVRPSSEGGRITEEDLRNYVRRIQEEAEAKSSKGVTPPGSPETDAFGAVRRERMSRLRQTIARTMTLSMTTIPQLTNFDDVDITEMERIRKESQRDYDAQGVKLTMLAFLVKAVAVGLKHHPVVNASVSEEGNEIIYKEYVNIGIAVDTDKGLVVPVLRDADRKIIPQIARELVQITDKVREGKYTIDDMRGGTFTISNLGTIGGTFATPIINPPESAILLIGRSRMLPQFIDGAFQPRLTMPLSLTYDHRIVDGAVAARFLNDVKNLITSPGRLLLAP